MKIVVCLWGYIAAHTQTERKSSESTYNHVWFVSFNKREDTVVYCEIKKEVMQIKMENTTNPNTDIDSHHIEIIMLLYYWLFSILKIAMAAWYITRVCAMQTVQQQVEGLSLYYCLRSLITILFYIYTQAQIYTNTYLLTTIYLSLKCLYIFCSLFRFSLFLIQLIIHIQVHSSTKIPFNKIIILHSAFKKENYFFYCNFDILIK